MEDYSMHGAFIKDDYTLLREWDYTEVEDFDFKPYIDYKSSLYSVKIYKKGDMYKVDLTFCVDSDYCDNPYSGCVVLIPKEWAMELVNR